MARIAAIQMTSGADVGANLDSTARLLREAASAHATLAVLPENFAFMGAHERDKLAHAEAQGRGPIQERLAEIARDSRLAIIAGTLPLAVPGNAEKVYAASLVFDAQGEIVARYDKIHLFDVDVPHGDKTECYRESRSIAGGATQAVVATTPAGAVGLSVCYDLRFPELYRALSAAGAQILSVPSAFTAKTGAAHWEILLRARAIENLAYVVAPGQHGEHPGGRRTWGHSMIVNPWGRVLAQCAEGEGVVIADVDPDEQRRTRENFPALQHRRF